jgi:hypothetical protein
MMRFHLRKTLSRIDHEGHVRIRQNTAVARDQVDELIGCEDGFEALES